MSIDANTQITISNEILFEEAYKKIEPELRGLTSDSLMQVNLDITSAVATIFGVMGELRRHRDQIAKQTPEFDLARFDRLEDYAMALSHANTELSAAVQPSDDLSNVRDEALKLRELLQLDLSTLIGRGYIDASTLDNLKGPNGYKNIAIDLQILATVLKDNWSKIQGKCAIDPAELDYALKLASHILRIVGKREQNPAIIAAAADLRVRAFTQFFRAYDDARRVIAYLRWQDGDADEIAPSLYAGRGAGRKKSGTEVTTAAPSSEAEQTSTTVPTATGTGTAGGIAPMPVASANGGKSVEKIDRMAARKALPQVVVGLDEIIGD